jgi:hypothetical protein
MHVDLHEYMRTGKERGEHVRGDMFREEKIK